jgi:hypothetical protein
MRRLRFITFCHFANFVVNYLGEEIQQGVIIHG